MRAQGGDGSVAERFVALCAAVLVVGSALSGTARAQSFDCAKAATPVELAVCDSADLRTADETLARVFNRAVAGTDADNAARMRTEQRAWVTERNSCGAQTGPSITQCLTRSYRSRTGALAEPPKPATLVSLPAGPPAGAARLSAVTVSAAGDNNALLTVDTPGRFALRASSKTGVAIQLVDMITGPGEIAGDVGVRDGRLDVLLDKGVYKVRTFGAKIAAGDATLSVTPFATVASADSALVRGGAKSLALSDLQQASFWVLVGADKRLSAEATGRALRDLRAWRNGVDLDELTPDETSVEPRAGHALTRLRLDGPVEPGLYLVTAYGGEPLAWTDSDTAQPLHVRVGPATPLPSGTADATIGPSGSLRFALPTSASYARLDLPEVAPVRLAIRRDKTVLGSDAVEKRSREPAASVSFGGGAGIVAEVIGQQGQKVHLRTLAPATTARVDSAGSFLVGVDVAGDGGDEVPATAILARFEKVSGKSQVIASTALRVAAGQAWRRKFNVRGPTTLLVEVAGSGPVAARTTGVGARITLEPLLGSTAPRADGKKPRQWDAEAGFYTLKIDPIAGAVGILDLTFGQPDVAVDPAPPSPPRPTIEFGLLTFERATAHQLFLNSAPHLVTGPRIRALPADLAAGALSVSQAIKPPAVSPPPPIPTPPGPIPPKPQRAEPALTPPPKPVAAGKPAAPPLAPGAPTPVARPLPPKAAPVLPPAPTVAAERPLVLPVRTPVGGTIAVSDGAGRAVPFTTSGDAVNKNIRSTTLTIAPSDVARTLTIVWTPNSSEEPMPTLARDAEGVKLIAGTPTFFDLGKDDRKTFALEVGDGGLYRVETLGRLQTSAAIGTRFVPKIEDAEDNGVGHNARIQTWLRAGSYRVRVGAQESAGHLGLVAQRAKLTDGGTLVADGSGRASLADGAGASFAIDIGEPGDYRLDLYGLDRTFTARLEDADGWPLTAPGEISTVRQRFEKGRYRLVVMPPDVDAQIVVRLRPVKKDAPLEGHGPHALPFDATASAQWREPATRDSPRAPDRFTFELAGPARISLATSDGMAGDLFLESRGAPIARIAKARDFAGDLAAGKYAVEMRALGRDDRLDYTLALRSDAIQPNRPRFVELPATIPFAIADDRVVGLTTFGETQLTGVLRNEAGETIERLSGRTDDWNLALSRRLPAGAYTLSLAALETPKASSDGESASDSEAVDNADDPPRAKAAAAADAENAERGNDTAIGDADADQRASKIEVRLALPAAAPAQPLALSGTTVTSGSGIRRFALPAVDAGALLLVAAQSDAEIVLSLERRDGAGHVSVAGFSRGRSPAVAVPVDADTRDGWEIATWSIDSGPATTTIAARVSTAAPQSGKRIDLAAIGDGPLTRWRVGRVATRGRELLSLAERVPDLRAGSRAGRPLGLFEAGLLAPQSESVWFVASADATVVPISTLNADAAPFSVTLDSGDIATMPVQATPPGFMRIWRADATEGQPGFLTDGGGAVAQNSAIALAGPTAVRLWNAAGSGPLSMRVAAQDIARATTADAGAGKHVLLSALQGQPLRLGAGPKRLSMQLASGTAAFLIGGEEPQAVWAPARAVTRTMTGTWTDVLFVNTTDKSAPASVDVLPSSEVAPLTAGHATKRFFGAGGSITVPVDAARGDRLTIAGADATFLGADGRVVRGSPVMPTGPGSLTLDYAPGLVVAALERGDSTPWSVPKPVMTTLPRNVALEGASMALALRFDTPVVLRVRSTAPVILTLRQNGVGDPEAMPLGAALRRYVPAGDLELRVFSAHDGPLSGTLELSAEPATPIGDGLGDPQVLAPGSSALFAFHVDRVNTVGIGMRADPDRVAVRLLDANGVMLGDGASQIRTLEKGGYLLEARAPADGPTVTVRPAVVGLKPRPSGPPPDVAARYLELVGMTSKAR